MSSVAIWSRWTVSPPHRYRDWDGALMEDISNSAIEFRALRVFAKQPKHAGSL